MSCTNVLGLVAACLSLCFLLTGLLTDYWLVDFGTGLTHEGLWHLCSRGTCIKMTDVDYISATRGLLIISTASLTFGILLSCLSFGNFSIGKVTPSLLATAMEFISVFFLIIGMSVYTGKTCYSVNNGSFNYQWSFFLCWTAVLTIPMAVISHFLAYKAAPAPGYESV